MTSSAGASSCADILMTDYITTESKIVPPVMPEHVAIV